MQCGVAVQQRVAGADNADEADDDDEAFVPGKTAEADSEDSNAHWWWQSTEARGNRSFIIASLDGSWSISTLHFLDLADFGFCFDIDGYHFFAWATITSSV
jgi:hypothetical protein